MNETIICIIYAVFISGLGTDTFLGQFWRKKIIIFLFDLKYFQKYTSSKEIFELRKNIMYTK